jgi:hypothetical protein
LTVSAEADDSKPGEPECSAGPIPVGIWRLNPRRSQLLSPKALTLWIIRNDDQELVWVAVETTAEQSERIVAWRGRYDGSPGTCTDAALSARLIANARKGIHTEGEFSGIGAFSEVCTLTADGRRMVCHGQVQTAAGTRAYLEDFDWVGPSPHEPAL